MRKRIRIAGMFFVFTLLWHLPLMAQDLDTIIDQVQQHYEETDDLQASFVQRSLIKSLGQTKESGGLVSFKKPGKMRWEYTEPTQQLLVSDGKTYWLYVPDDEQVIVQEAEDAYGSKTPITFLSGMGKLQNDFYMKLLPPEVVQESLVSGHRLELLPKQPQPDVAKLILTVDEETFQIVHTAVYDPYGNITDVYLQQIEMNFGLPDELFTFEIPTGVDIIRQDQ
jgi:outer membrane lipoprotein carrier protein